MIGGKLRSRTKIDFFKLGYLYHKILMDNKAKKITKPWRTMFSLISRICEQEEDKSLA